MRSALLAAAGLMLAFPAAAEDDKPTKDPCAEAAELREQIEEVGAQVAEMIEAAKPVCAERALARECARRRVEIRGFMRSLRELNAQRKAAEAECRKSK